MWDNGTCRLTLSPGPIVWAKGGPVRVAIDKQAHFLENDRRMKYATVAEQGTMTGSGVGEAARKTLVIERIQRSGQRWRMKAARSILTPRG